jgi:hypothetical protein
LRCALAQVVQQALAELIVLVKHRHALAPGALQLTQQETGFLLVAGAHVEDQAIEGFAQGGGPGVRGDQRNAGLADGRQRRQHRGRAGKTEQREYLVAPDQLLGIGQGAFGLVAVIQAQQPHAPPMHAATGIDLGEIAACPFLEVAPDLGGRAGKGGRLAQHDFLRAHPVLGRLRSVQAARHAQGQTAAPDNDRVPVPSHLPLPPKNVLPGGVQVKEFTRTPKAAFDDQDGEKCVIHA